MGPKATFSFGANGADSRCCPVPNKLENFDLWFSAEIELIVFGGFIFVTGFSVV